MEFMLLGIFFAMCLGLIPGLIAQSKGRSFAEWWLYGTALSRTRHCNQDVPCHPFKRRTRFHFGHAHTISCS